MATIFLPTEGSQEFRYWVTEATGDFHAFRSVLGRCAGCKWKLVGECGGVGSLVKRDLTKDPDALCQNEFAVGFTKRSVNGKANTNGVQKQLDITYADNTNY